MTGTTYVIDTGPLSHFARGQWLGALKAVLQPSRVVIPDVVERELLDGVAQHGYLRAVLDAHWIDVVPLDTDAHLRAFAFYSQRLVGDGERNVGECGVLALADTLPSSIAVLDDLAAVKVAQQRGIQVRRTLGLLCDAIRDKLLTVSLVSALADDLIANQYRLPFGPGEFAHWAEDNGLI